jgi:hypothetical protein
MYITGMTSASPRTPMAAPGASTKKYGSTDSALGSSSPLAAFDLSVMQLNAWLIPVRPGFPGCLDFQAFNRAKRMGLWLEEQAIDKRLDIAIFQEVWTPWRSFVACSIHSAFCCSLFGRHFIENSLSKVLPYYTRVHGSRPCDCTKRFFDSGLVIASRFPIIEETFKIYPSGSPHDALSSKGILVAALQRPDDNAIIIVGSSHLDAGDDDSFKISQLQIAIDTMKQFSMQIQAKYSSSQIIATLFGSDMNIDGIEFWSDSNSYCEAKRMLEGQGFKDSWTLTSRPVPQKPETSYNPDQHPELGITSDQHGCVKRLDYIWACPGPMGEQSASGSSSPGAAVPPTQQDMGQSSHLSRKAIRRFGVSAKTELNDGVLWRSSKSMRVDLDKAVIDGNKKRVHKLASRIDRHDREMRLSDHAALFAKLHFFPHP